MKIKQPGGKLSQHRIFIIGPDQMTQNTGVKVTYTTVLKTVVLGLKCYNTTNYKLMSTEKKWQNQDMFETVAQFTQCPTRPW